MVCVSRKREAGKWTPPSVLMLGRCALVWGVWRTRVITLLTEGKKPLPVLYRL